MSTESDIAVVIPAWNEEESIGKVIESIRQRRFDPLVVDDGSKDRTAEIAQSCGAQVILQGENQGYEAALSTGIHAAWERGYPFAITFDADGQLDPDDILRFRQHLDRDNSDLVTGLRSYRNRWSEHLVAWFSRFRFGLKDPLCGIKLYRLQVASRFFPFDSHELVGMELAMRMADAGRQISQLPIKVERRKGESRYGMFLKGEMKILTAFGRVLKLFGVVRKGQKDA